MAEPFAWPPVLNLGCGRRPLAGAVNHDRAFYFPHVDHAWDLAVRPWPWPDASFHTFVALDVLEHLDDVVGFMDECWRVLSPGGQLELRVPYYRSETVAIDPTHRRGFHPRSFEYFTVDGPLGQTFHYTSKRWRVLRGDAGPDGFGNLHFLLEKA